MARVVKEEEHAGKRAAILDVARRLIFTKGYEQMTIQDMLDELQISKGAFYHYFSSKQEVLEALIERIQGEVEKVLSPIVDDPELGALAKLQRFFPTLSGWKTAHRTLLLSLTRILYADDNAIFRQKTFSLAAKRMTPLLATIIRQGMQEGVLATSYPDEVSEVIVRMGLALGETLAELLLTPESGPDALPHAQRIVAAYTDVLECTLRVSSGSLTITDPQMLREWFVTPTEHA